MLRWRVSWASAPFCGFFALCHAFRLYFRGNRLGKRGFFRASLLTLNALTASDRLIIPVQAQFLAMRGMAKLMQVVHKVQQRLNSDLSIAGVLITQYDGRKNLNKSVSELVQETFQGKVFSTHIRNAITLAEAPTQGQDIFHSAPKSAGAEDYEKVCNELLTEIK